MTKVNSINSLIGLILVLVGIIIADEKRLVME
jgi:hypothetical protein